MKLLILSDLHLEVCRKFAAPKSHDFDAVILAGDIDTPGWRGIRWAARTFVSVPVLFVAGNHEYFRQRADLAVHAMRQTATELGVHFMDRSTLVVGGIRFLGCTLWTDFCLAIKGHEGERVADQQTCRREAEANMPDYRFVRVADSRAVPGSRREAVGRPLDTDDTLRYHRRDASWLSQALAEPFAGTTVVVTHHAPHWKSVSGQFQQDHLSGAFASDLPSSFFEVPTLWVHGHTHASFDYSVGQCRVVCNPRGYVVDGADPGNPNFRHGMVIDVT
ncbi:metallophosphoesterase [Variovorax sp. J22P240]|uniref:metallophosphoesterase n=1 Tax=Variovorax sp. J22P240 TaxID=3053514 RepID=UPI002578A9C3|nr:metallophosphoesterase [Variovorax sp. J22P240]MDL9998310.1 metallophosphoesterase [Variovorax sp. J22P240]